MSLTTSFPYIFHTLFIKDLNLITYNDILKMTYFNENFKIILFNCL